MSRKVTVTRRIIEVAIGAVALLLGLIVVVLLLVTPAEPQPDYRLVFSHGGSSPAGIYVVNPDGSDLRWIREAAGYLSPDGRWLATYRTVTWIHDAMGFSVVPIVNLEIVRVPTGEVGHHLYDLELQPENSFYDCSVAWSPDGAALAYLSYPARGHGVDIWVYDLITETATNVTNDEEYRDFITWSPDGEWVLSFIPARVTAKAPTLYYNIEAVRADGSERQIIADMHAAGFDVYGVGPWSPPFCNVAWSPDGDYITFEDGCEPFHPQRRLFVAAADGSGVHLLLETRENRGENMQVEYDASWSPSGDRLSVAYSRWIFTTPRAMSSRYSELTAQTGVVVFDAPSFSIVETAEPLKIYSTSVRWSPDGRFLLLHQHEYPARAPSTIAMAEFSDGRVRASDIAAGLPGDLCPWPQWSPDGRYIAYVRSGTSERCQYDPETSILVVSFPDGRVTDVTASLGGRNDLIGWIPDTSE